VVNNPIGREGQTKIVEQAKQPVEKMILGE